GSDVAKQYESLARHLEATESTPVETAPPVRGWARFAPKRVMGLLLETLSGVFTPIVAAISGAGLLKGLNALAIQLGWLVPGTDAYLVWTLMADGIFYFLPFLVAVSAAKRFNVNVSLALAVPAALLYPTIVGGVAAVADGGPAGLEFLGLTVPFVNYASAVVPPILGVYLMGWVYRLLDRFVPPMLKIVVTPLLTLVITIPIVLVAIAPAGNYLGMWAADGLVWLYEHGGALAGIVLGGTAPLIVLIGMHYALFPVALQSLATRGYDVFLLPFQFIANLATAGATLAVAIRHKNDRALALSTALPAFFGITEPAIYGVTLRLKRPFYFTLAGGAVGGAYAAAVGLQCFGFAVPGLTSLPLYVSPDNPNNVVNALISIALSFGTALLLTLFFFKPEPTPEQASAATPTPAAGSSVVETPVTSPVTGRVIALS
ncbi:MAG: PTS transporter subunit EIIC, partial [Propionibacteriaceae bacterium]|nr:PTS transporter subunit EIIC [Propionibacteriaceae bacterium]